MAGSGGVSSPPRTGPRGGNPGSPKPFRGNGGSSVSTLRHAALSALSANASGSTAAALLATPTSLTLAVPSVGTGAAFASVASNAGGVLGLLAETQMIVERAVTLLIGLMRHCEGLDSAD